MENKKSPHTGKPRQKSGLLWSQRVNTVDGRWTPLAAVFLLVALVSSCAPIAPRFRGGGARPASSASGARPVTASKDSSNVQPKDEETSAEGAEKIASGARSFKTEKNAAITNLDQAKMMREISKMMGVSYKLGGDDEHGIDCSAYTMNVYKNSIGKPLPRTSGEQFTTGIPVQYEDLKFGDLVFFNTTGEVASHVGIYLGDDLFAHASVSLGVTISSLESFYYKQRYEGARRIVH
jgi:murein DD-endopeptidase / murein LD-carboxypeptidase